MEHDPRAALLGVEKLAGSGRDVAQFTRDLAAHLRHLFVVQTLGSVPDSFSVTAEHTDRLAAQADRLAQGEVLRAIDLLAAALSAVKDGSDPRIQLELALLKAVQPQSDLSMQALVFRIERLERLLAQGATAAPAPAADARARPALPSAAADPDHGRSAPTGRFARSGPTERAASVRGGGRARVDRDAPRGAGPLDAPGRGRAGPCRPPSRRPCRARAATAGALAQAEPAPASSAAPELDLVRSLWPAALDAVRLENAMVAALLQEARPSAWPTTVSPSPSRPTASSCARRPRRTDPCSSARCAR